MSIVQFHLILFKNFNLVSMSEKGEESDYAENIFFNTNKLIDIYKMKNHK